MLGAGHWLSRAGSMVVVDPERGDARQVLEPVAHARDVHIRLGDLIGPIAELKSSFKVPEILATIASLADETAAEGIDIVPAQDAFLSGKRLVVVLQVQVVKVE